MWIGPERLLGVFLLSFLYWLHKHKLLRLCSVVSWLSYSQVSSEVGLQTKLVWDLLGRVHSWGQVSLQHLIHFVSCFRLSEQSGESATACSFVCIITQVTPCCQDICRAFVMPAITVFPCLYLCAGYLLADDAQGETPLIPPEIMEYSIKQSNDVDINTTLQILGSPGEKASSIPGCNRTDSVIRSVWVLFMLVYDKPMEVCCKVLWPPLLL